MLVVALALVAAAFAPASGAAGAPTPLRVYVVVLDGLRPSEVNATLTPTLTELKGEGTWYEQSRSVLIAETLPNHAAMMTGVLPQRSGIVGNDYWFWSGNGTSSQKYRMEEPGLLQADTLTTRLENGCDISTATVQSKFYLWGLFRGEPGKPGDPNPQREADFHWNPQTSRFYVGSPDDHALDVGTMNEAFLPWVKSNPPTPQFAFVNLGDIDRGGHVDEFAGSTDEGLSTSRQGALKNTDSQLKLLVDELKGSGAWDQTVLIFVSDHGFDWGEFDDAINVQTELQNAGYTADSNGRPGKETPTSKGDFWIVGNGGAGMVYAEDPQNVAPMAEVLAAKPGVDFVATRQSIPGLDNPTLAQLGMDSHNSGDVVVFMKPGWRVGDGNPLPGNHGHAITQHNTLLVTGGHPVLRSGGGLSVPGELVYDPSTKRFSPPAAGPGNLSIAPTVAALLGIGAPPGGYDGTPLTGAFKAAALAPHTACQAADVTDSGGDAQPSGGNPGVVAGPAAEGESGSQPLVVARCSDVSRPTTYVSRRSLRISRRRISFSGRALDRGCRRPGEPPGPLDGRISRVQVAVARTLPGGRCQYLLPGGRLGRARSCRSPVYRSVGARYDAGRQQSLWTFSRRAALRPGVYRVLARSRDLAGNLGSARRFISARLR